MNICYLDFWPGFDSNSNWFNLMFLDFFEGKELNFNSSPEKADIIMFSCFGSEHHYKNKNPKAVKIFYTGENERVRFPAADYALSFDHDTYGERNFRLPHWYLYINWWGAENFPHATISPEKLFSSYNPEEVYDRKNFCSIVIGNPVSNRLEVANKLNEYKPVHGFGRVFGRPFDGCKVDLLQNYRYNICFENAIHPGYVTEKLLQAKVAGCIPIYYGTDSANLDFNEKCFIRYGEYETPDLLLEKIKEIDLDKTKFIEIANQPLFNDKPNLDNLYLFLKKALKYYA